MSISDLFFSPSEVDVVRAPIDKTAKKAAEVVVDPYRRIKAATKRAATALGGLQGVTVKLRGGATSPRKAASSDKRQFVRLDGAADFTDEGPDQLPFELALSCDDDDTALEMAVALPDGSTATLTRAKKGQATMVSLDSQPCGSIKAGLEITYQRADGTDATLTLRPTTTAVKVASTMVNTISLGALCCTGDVTSTVYNATRKIGGSTQNVGRVVVDNARGKARTLIVQMSGEDQSAKLDLLLTSFYVAADIAAPGSKNQGRSLSFL